MKKKLFLLIFGIMIRHLYMWLRSDKNSKVITYNNDYVFINNKLKINIVTFEDRKLIVIDNFLKLGNSYRNLLSENIFTYDTGSDYPGSRITVNNKIHSELKHFVETYINPKIYKCEGSLYSSNSSYSIIASPNNKLRMGNIFPHTDCTHYKTYKYSGIANVIYLCDQNEKYGGTGFYKKNYPVGQPYFITSPQYEEQRNYILNAVDNPKYCYDKKQYLYKKIYQSDIKFNRAIFYPTSYLHQPIINDEFYEFGQPINSSESRLTLTSWHLYDKKIPLDNYHDLIHPNADDRADPNNENFNIQKYNQRINEVYL